MSEPGDDLQWRPSHSPWAVTFAVILPTFMAMVSTMVANVALPIIAGNLAASTNESTWVLTSYMTASAIVLAATGWLSSYFGRKAYLMFSVALFTCASAACGLAQSMPQLIMARIAQGIGGGALQPLTLAIILESFSDEERGTAVAAYSTCMIVAPVIGPVLGGWITNSYSWRWIFYMNIPICIFGFLMQKAIVEDPPYLEKAGNAAVDYIGLGFMVIAIGTLQVVLDKGQQLDWFSSNYICWGAGVVLIAMPLFIWWELKRKTPFINLRLLKDRNLIVGTCLAATMASIMYASTALLPIFMQKLLKYSVLQSGLTMMPGGVGSMVAVLIVGLLIKKVGDRGVMMSGFLVMGIACIMFSFFNMSISRGDLLIPQIISGFGSGLLFVPLTAISMSTMRKHELNQATGIYNLLRNIGASIGISVIFAYQTRMAQVHQASLVPNITNYTPVYQQWAAHLGTNLTMTYAIVYSKVMQQVSMLAFIDCFRWLTVLCFICIPLTLLFKKHQFRRDEVLIAEETLKV